MSPARSRAIADAAVAEAKEAVSTSPTPSEPELTVGDNDGLSAIEIETLGAYPYRPWQRLKSSAGFLLDKQNQWVLGGGVAAVLGAKALDSSAQDYFAHKPRLGGLEKLGNEVLGTGVPGVLVGAGFWLFGDLSNRWYESHAGQAQLETLLVTGVLTSILKASVSRERPDGSDHFSFPSGHTSTVFASAMVLQEFYGWKAGVPAFMLGALTAASRMQDNRHWLSDTVGGALLGVVIGHAISRAHLNHFNSALKVSKKKTAKIQIYPSFESGGGQLVFKATF